MRRPRIVPPFYLLAAVLAMAGLHRWLPISNFIWGYWRWAGLVPIAAGLLLGGWVAAIFKHRKTTIRPGETSSQLVTDGPFRISRNPIYLGMALLLVGIAILLGSVSPWIIPPAFFAVISVDTIPMEEKMLMETFDRSYRDYVQRVRRWI